MTSQKTEHIAVLVSEEVSTCLLLQSAIRGIGKGPIVRELLQDHIEREGWTVDQLTTELAAQLYGRWFYIHKDKRDFETYLEIVGEDLEKRLKFSDHLVEETLKKCREQQKRNPLQIK